MNKLLLLGFLVGLACPVFADNSFFKERAIGTGVGISSPLSWSLDLLWRPRKLVGGISVGNFYSSKFFQGAPLTIQSLDLTFLLGYWSNVEKKHLLGWHAYGGIGFSFVDVLSHDFAYVTSFVKHDKVGLGLDWYFWRKVQKYSLAFTIDVAATFRPVQVKQRFVDGSKVFQVDPSIEDGSVLFGFRFWY